MSFSLVTLQSQNPVVFYDGGEPGIVALTARVEGHDVSLGIDLEAPECWHWRHYFNDQELNELWPMLGLRFKFLVNSEVVVEPSAGRQVYFQPFIVGESEVSVCFTYSEVSYGHYMFWLVGIVKRPLPHSTFTTRVEHVKKYWANNG